MRPVFQLGRLCFRSGFQRVRPVTIPLRFGQRQFHSRFCGNAPRKSLRRLPVGGTVLLAALSPAAFLELSEEERGDGESAETHMLDASRQELQKEIPDDVHGLRRILWRMALGLDQYIYEPLATGFRFLHLVIIFVPVIVSVPVIWFGARQKGQSNERTGTLWWYGFLVHAMERAGPAFIKVRRRASDQVGICC